MQTTRSPGDPSGRGPMLDSFSKLCNEVTFRKCVFVESRFRFSNHRLRSSRTYSIFGPTCAEGWMQMKGGSASCASRFVVRENACLNREVWSSLSQLPSPAIYPTGMSINEHDSTTAAMETVSQDIASPGHRAQRLKPIGIRIFGKSTEPWLSLRKFHSQPLSGTENIVFANWLLILARPPLYSTTQRPKNSCGNIAGV